MIVKSKEGEALGAELQNVLSLLPPYNGLYQGFCYGNQA